MNVFVTRLPLLVEMQIVYVITSQETAEQFLQHVDLPILDRKDGTDYGQIFQGCPTEQQGL